LAGDIERNGAERRAPLAAHRAIVCLPIQIETPFDIRFAPSDLFLSAGGPAGPRRVARGALDLEPVARGLLCLFLVWVLAKGLTVGAIRNTTS